MTKVVIYSLSVISAIFVIAVVLLALFGNGVLWKMILPEDEALIGDHQIPEALTTELSKEDLLYLSNQILDRTPYAATMIDTGVFRREIDSLLIELDSEGPDNILALYKIIALPMKDNVGGGHTKIPLMQRPLDWKFYPFYAYMFDDGLWIITAGNSYSDIVGAQILEINQVPVDKIYRKAKPFISADNEMSKLDEFPNYLSFEGFLKQLGILSENGVLELTLRHPGGNSNSVRIEPVGLFSFAGLRWARDLRERVKTWCPADPRRRSRNYWFRYMEDKKAVYLQFNRVQNESDESIREFTDRLAKFVQSNPVDRFIVDIRSNGGGNNQLLEPLIAFISGHPEIDREGVLYTLIGRRTFSAAGTFAMAMELRTRTLFVGEKSGFTPNQVGDAVTIPLPNSRILVNISGRFWQSGGPYDTTKWIEPDIKAPLSYEDYAKNNDPGLEAALSHEATNLPEPELSNKDIRNLANSMVGVYEFGPLRTLRIRADSTGFANFHITYVGDWASSEIYLPAINGGPFSTDIKDVYLKYNEKGQLVIDWKGVQRILKPLNANAKNATERLLAITKDSTSSVADVTRSFQDLHNRGIIFDSQIEWQLNATGYWLLHHNRPEDAVRIFELQTELFPFVANGFDSMGDGYLALSKQKKAAEAYKAALRIDPGFTHAKSMLRKMSN